MVYKFTQIKLTKMISNIIIKSALVFSGSTLGSCHVHIPEVHEKASPAVVSDYLNGNARYNLQKDESQWSASEVRKQQLLADIRGLRADIRKQWKSMQERDQIAEKVIETCATMMMEKNKQRDYEVSQRPGYNHLNSLPVYLKAAVIKKRLAMVSIELV